MTKKQEEEVNPKVKAALESLSNADRRAVAKYYGESLESIAGDGDEDAADVGTMTVISAYLLDNRAHSLEHYDHMSFTELTELVQGITEAE